MKKTSLLSVIVTFCLGAEVCFSADYSAADDVISLKNPEVLFIITPISVQSDDRPKYGSVGGRSGDGHGYSLKTRPNQQIWMSFVSRGQSSSVRTLITLKDGTAILKTQVTALGDRSLKFAADLETSGIHYNLEYQKTYSGPVAFRVSPILFSPFLCVPTMAKVGWLDYFAPYSKDLEANQFVSAFSSQPGGPLSLRINGKIYESNDYIGVQLMLEPAGNGSAEPGQ